MFEAVLIGLGVGGIYAISALGIVAINRGTGVLNLAHGAVATWGAYIYASLTLEHGWSQPLAMLAVLLSSAAGGAVMYSAFLSPVRGRTPLIKLVMTLGIQAGLMALLERAFDTNSLRQVPSWLPDDGMKIFGASVGEDRLILLGIAAVLTVALEVWSSRARLPISTRALCDNERAAVALGASPRVLGTINWALGSALAGCTGAFIVPIVGLGEYNVSFVLVPALAAALLGRFISFPLAFAGGVVLGVGQSIVTRYVSTPGWEYVVPLGVIIIALTAQRSRDSNRIMAQAAPRVGNGRFRPLPTVLVFGGTIAYLLTLDGTWIDAMTASLCYAVLGLSAVVLFGFAYQISLAQFAMAGLGALVAAQLAIHAHVPFILSPLVGAAAGGIVGVVVGLPALRIRGINLAVVTLGLGLAIEKVFLSNPSYTGGFNGLTPPVPNLWGYDVDAAVHPQRYAFVVLAWVVIATLGVYILRHSRLGHRLLAIRTNERASSSIGVNLTFAKLAAFSVSSALAGLAGVLLGFQQTQVSFVDFTSGASMSLIILAVIAGVGGISGGIVVGIIATGGVLFRLFEHVQWLQDNYALIAAVGLIISIIANEDGIVLSGKPRPIKARRRAPKSELPPAISAPEALQAKGLRASFGGVVAVTSMDVTVPPGRVVGIVGPNGAGKTTLLDIVSGFLPGRRFGEVAIGDRALEREPTYKRARAGIGRGFQAIELFEDLSIRDNFELATQGSSRSKGASLCRAAAESTEHFGLSDVLDQRPSELSLAQRRLAGVVRALATNPAVVVLDEPGAGLTSSESASLGRELREIAAKYDLGVLVIDHDMGLITSACDELIVMANGALVTSGAPDEVLRDARVRDIYLGESPAVTEADTEVSAEPTAVSGRHILDTRTIVPEGTR